MQKIQLFIKMKWKSDHILALDSSFLAWQHKTPNKKLLNFVGAFLNPSQRLDGILGYIPTWQFDPKLEKENELWFALWKVDENQAQKVGLGLDLLLFLEKTFCPNFIGTVGINPKTKTIYEFLGYQIAELNHYFLPNSKLSNHVLCKVASFKKPIQKTSPYSLKPIKDLSKFSFFQSNQRPQKTIDYLISRYTNHPYYHYISYGVFKENLLLLILITRKISIQRAICIKIVDIFGEPAEVGCIESNLLELIDRENAEYIDCYNYGIPSQVFARLGFREKAKEDIIPNYFEPFEKRNVRLECVFKTNHTRCAIFRGDADQDRPSHLHQKSSTE